MTWRITGKYYDEHFSNVSLLLHGDGTNGSTTIVDSSPNPKTVIALGNAQISTAQSKFGGSSLAFDGSGDYLSVATSADLGFGTGDFTIETWFWRADSGQQHIYNGRRGTTVNTSLLYLNSSTQLTYYADGAVRISSSSVPPANDWCHIAVCRGSGSTRLFLDGVQVGSTYSDSIDYAAPLVSLYLGCNDSAGGSFVSGYIDDLRVTKGVARYTSNFTPPIAPFPNY
jgi:hypothetical protein